MALVRVTSPHLSRAGNTGDVMLLVALALAPGLAMLTWFFGWGNLINVIWAVLVAVASEALVLAIRKRLVGTGRHLLCHYHRQAPVRWHGAKPL